MTIDVDCNRPWLGLIFASRMVDSIANPGKLPLAQSLPCAEEPLTTIGLIDQQMLTCQSSFEARCFLHVGLASLEPREVKPRHRDGHGGFRRRDSRSGRTMLARVNWNPLVTVDGRAWRSPWYWRMETCTCFTEFDCVAKTDTHAGSYTRVSTATVMNVSTNIASQKASHRC